MKIEINIDGNGNSLLDAMEGICLSVVKDIYEDCNLEYKHPEDAECYAQGKVACEWLINYLSAP